MASKTPKTATTAPKVTGDVAKAAADSVKAAAKTQADATKTVIDAVAKAAKAPAAIPAAIAATAKPAEPKPATQKPTATKTVPVDATAAKAVAAPARAVHKAVKPVVEAAAPLVEATAEAAKTVPDAIQQTVETVVSATPKVAPTVEKDVTKMATQFETPKMFTDVSDRAQAAFAKSQSMVAEMGEFGKGNVEAMVESGKIAAKGLETLGQDAADYTRRSFEGMTSTLKSLASVKSPTEFFKLQSDYMRSAFDQAVAQSSKNTEAMIKLASDAAQPLSNRFATAVEKVKTAA